MNFLTEILILLTLSGVSLADTVCDTSECKETENLITSSINSAIDPCNDFYEYSCGNWKKQHPLTSANPNSVSHFEELTVNLTNKLLSLLDASTVAKEAKYDAPLVNFYKGCVNTNLRDSHASRDYKIIKDAVDKVGGWPLIDEAWDEASYDVEKALIELNKLMLSKVILSVAAMSDLKNNSQPILSLTNPFVVQGVIEGIYRVPQKDEHKILQWNHNFDKYYDLTAANPILLAAEAIKGSAVNAALYQKDMTAVQSLTQQLQTIATPINNAEYIFENYDKFKITAKDLTTYKNIDLRKIVDGILNGEDLELEDTDVIFADKEYLSHLGSILQHASKRTIANTIGVNLAVNYIRFTTTEMALSVAGVPNAKAMPQVCLSYAQQILPDLLGRFYFDKLFSKESIDDMKGFIASLKDSFHQILEENTWLDATTKQSAIKKLNAIASNVAFPDYLFNDTQLSDYYKNFDTTSDNTFLSTMINALYQQRKENTRALVDPEPKGHWPEPANAVMVNAFYNPEVNGIFFPAAIAQFPFYQHTRPQALNLGAIGMVISHELTHAFDNQGSLFDDLGNLHNWFGAKSQQTFNEKAQCFVDQYSKFTYTVGATTLKLNGLRTLGENIADNGGIRIAYKALETYNAKNAGKLLKLPGAAGNHTDEQLFFLSYANVWCTNKGPNAIASQIAQDPHSLEDARVIATLANFPEFSKAFNCKAATRMNPTNKCVLWG